MSGKDTGTGPSPTGQKQRSPIERMLVWGLIGILLVLLAFEWWVRNSFVKGQGVLRDAVAAGDTGQAPSIDEVEKRLSGSPSKSTKKSVMGQTVVYQWRSLFKSYTLEVEIGDQKEVLSAGTP